MKFPEVKLRKDPQILSSLLHAKARLAVSNKDTRRYMLICTALCDSPVTDEIRKAIHTSMDTNTLWQWLARQGHVLMDVELQALRRQWLDSMILDQIELPVVKLRRGPEIKAVLLEAKEQLAQSGYLCIAVSHACFVLNLNDFFHEVTNAILSPLGSRESATDFFREQAELTNDQCQALRHRWLDRLIKEQL